ncbi:hypothetical protein F511_42467 [Dorcoceras hygrometricum]|uniref:Uncharacterized protein n=1 Tax=Dorcoceras hygrometricum TaxID=472368 RepID=A0A2Z7B6U6_9LAMI|nr:hypothetical protein F511_42467 [Dorcoceras hygrometricum]
MKSRKQVSLVGPNKTLEEFRPAVTTSPETRRSGGRPVAAIDEISCASRGARGRDKHGAPSTTCANRARSRPAIKRYERRDVAASASQRPASIVASARQAAHHRPTFAQLASPLLPASVWPTGAASCEKCRPALAQYRASFAYRSSSVGRLLRVHRAWPLALKRTYCGRYRQFGRRPEPRLLRQPALEALTNSARTDSPRRIGRNEFRQLEAAAALGGGGGGL